MAATDAGLDHIADQTHSVAENLSRANKSAEGLSDSFKAAALAVLGVGRINSIVDSLLARSQTYMAVQKALSAEQLTHSVLMQQYRDRYGEALAITRKAKDEGRKINDEEKLHLEVLRQQFKELRAQRALAFEMQAVGKIRLAAATTAALLGADLYIKQRQFNQDLIEANSSWENRAKLMGSTLMVQTQLGVSFGKATEAARALVAYALDTEPTYRENVRLVVQMQQGLGVSVDESARLATIVERQLKGSFSDVSHVIAQIVEDTALAGNEAAKLANNIATALGRLRPGLGAAGLPEVVRLVGRYESALKEVGGESGAFTQLLTTLTRPEGIVGMGLLRVQPEFLATSKGVESVMDRFAKYGQMMVGQAQGLERQFRLQILAEQFSITADQANQMLIAIQQVNREQTGSITLQDRWRNQIRATDQGVIRLANSLTGLVQGALYPFVFVIGAIVNKVADILEGILEFKGVAVAMMIGVGIGVAALAVQMWRLAATLWAVVVSTNAVAAAQVRLAAVQTSTTALQRAREMFGLVPRPLLSTATTFMPMAGPGAAAGGTLARWFPTLTQGIVGLGGILTRGFLLIRGALSFLLLNPIGLLITGVSLVGYFAAKQWFEIRRLREENRKAEQVIIDKTKLLEHAARARIFRTIREGGSVENVENQVAALMRQASLQPELEKMTSTREKVEFQKQWMLEHLPGLEQDFIAALTARGMFVSPTERLPQEEKRDTAMIDLNKRIAISTAQAASRLDAANKAQIEREDREEIERAKNRAESEHSQRALW